MISRYTPFPPENHITPSKVDLQIESGEYFLSEKQKAERAATKKRVEAKLKMQKKKEERGEKTTLCYMRSTQKRRLNEIKTAP